MSKRNYTKEFLKTFVARFVSIYLYTFTQNAFRSDYDSHSYSTLHFQLHRNLPISHPASRIAQFFTRQFRPAPCLLPLHFPINTKLERHAGAFRGGLPIHHVTIVEHVTTRQQSSAQRGASRWAYRASLFWVLHLFERYSYIN